MLSPIATASRSPQLHRYSRVYFSSIEEEKKKNKERDLISEQLTRVALAHKDSLTCGGRRIARDPSWTKQLHARRRESVAGGKRRARSSLNLLSCVTFGRLCNRWRARPSTPSSSSLLRAVPNHPRSPFPDSAPPRSRNLASHFHAARVTSEIVAFISRNTCFLG